MPAFEASTSGWVFSFIKLYSNNFLSITNGSVGRQGCCLLIIYKANMLRRKNKYRIAICSQLSCLTISAPIKNELLNIRVWDYQMSRNTSDECFGFIGVISFIKWITFCNRLGYNWSTICGVQTVTAEYDKMHATLCFRVMRYHFLRWEIVFIIVLENRIWGLQRTNCTLRRLSLSLMETKRIIYFVHIQT